MNKNLLIVGAGQYGCVAKEIAESMNCFQKIDFLDDCCETAVGSLNEYEKLSVKYAYALPTFKNSENRLKWMQKLQGCGYQVPILVSPKAYISPLAQVMAGAIIEPFAVLNCKVLIGRNCFIGANATVDCGTVIGEGSTICCGATVIGNTLVFPKTTVEHGQICYGEALSKKVPQGGTYNFDDVM